MNTIFFLLLTNKSVWRLACVRITRTRSRRALLLLLRMCYSFFALHASTVAVSVFFSAALPFASIYRFVFIQNLYNIKRIMCVFNVGKKARATTNQKCNIDRPTDRASDGM